MVRGALVDLISICYLSPQALVLADSNHPRVTAGVAQVARARWLVVAMPVYEATYDLHGESPPAWTKR